MQIFADSAKEALKPKTIAIVAMLIASHLVLDRFTIIVGPTMHIGLTFLTTALAGFLFGPVVGLYAGGLTDIIAYFAYPKDGFFFGFTISAMTSGLIYGALLYKRKPALVRILVALALNCLVVNIGLNTLWLSMMYGKAFIVLVGARAVKSIILLPIETGLLFMTANLALRVKLPGR